MRTYIGAADGLHGRSPDQSLFAYYGIPGIAFSLALLYLGAVTYQGLTYR